MIGSRSIIVFSLATHDLRNLEKRTLDHAESSSGLDSEYTTKMSTKVKPQPSTPPQPSEAPQTPLPINWPAHVPYLTKPAYSPHLTPAHLGALRTRPAPDPSDPLPEIPRNLKPGPCPAVRIVPITDPNRTHRSIKPPTATHVLCFQFSNSC